MKLSSRLDYRRRRHLRLRKNIRGTSERPRMSVSITGRRMYVQFIDDELRVTMASASTLKMDEKGKNNVEIARKLGEAAAQAALGEGIKAAIFDRGGGSYKGRMKAIAEAARAAGLEI